MLKQAKVLIVDDDPQLLRAMQRMLEADFKVTVTSEAEQVIQLVRTETFAVVVVDLVMPGMTGIEILNAVKQISPTTEVIIVTGYASIRTVKQALRAGAYDYLERPFSEAEIQHVVRNAVLHHQLAYLEDEVWEGQKTPTKAQLLARIRELEGRLAVEETRTFQNTVELLYRLIGIRQQETMLHLRSVEDYAVPIAQRLGYNEAQQESVRIAAAFHDIGKLAVDEAILYKPGPLDEAEWAVMREHPRMGAIILQGIPDWEEAALGVLYHQERYDGQGYPEGLAGEAIPSIARIVAVADAYDAMTSSRPYKPALSRTEALLELERNAGTQFDPEVVETFVRLM